MKKFTYTLICIAAILASIFYSASRGTKGQQTDYFQRVSTTRVT
jgi:hypothetical protein